MGYLGRVRAAAYGIAVVSGGIWLSTSCAQSDSPIIPPAIDDASTDAVACGNAGQPCCAQAVCQVGAFCNSGTCKPQNPKDIGKPCTAPADCQTGLCSLVEGLGEGGVMVPEGGTPPQPTACSTGCTDTSQCTAGWTCTNLVLGEGVCTCSWMPQTCDGMDDDCNGVIDDKAPADAWCTVQNGVPQVCSNGQCVCVDMCDGNCVDLGNDSENCGACGKTCKPTVEKCQAKQCVCAFTQCKGDGGATDCIDTTTDRNNCGGCGQPCGYGCAMGACGPLTLGTATGYSEFVAVDSTNVYWVAGNFPYALNKCPIGGCVGSPTTLVSGITSIGGMVAGGGAVFWVNNSVSPGLIDSCDGVNGCNNTPVPFASNQSSPLGIAADANNIYWADTGSNQIMQCPITGTCVPNPLASTPNPKLVAVDATNIYWSSFSGAIWTSPLSGGTATQLASNQFPGQMVAMGGRVFWANGIVWTCPAAGCNMTPTTFDNSFTYTENYLATDGSNLYWSQGDASPKGAIKKCAPGATCPAPTVVASQLGSPTYLAVDANSVYWLEGGSGAKIKSFKK